MTWLTAAIEIIKGFFKAIPILDKWFSKTATEKADKARLDEREKADEFKKTGRPKW